LFSAFLAILGKQWLDRCQSTDMSGSAVERTHTDSKNSPGIIGWYFDSVVELLSLVLQPALLLLGCAVSL
jgi:hypothetical protein